MGGGTLMLNRHFVKASIFDNTIFKLGILVGLGQIHNWLDTRYPADF